MLSSKILSYLLVFIIVNLLMAELHANFCCLFLPSLLIIERVGEMGSGVGWGETGRGGVGVGGGKNYP